MFSPCAIGSEFRCLRSVRQRPAEAKVRRRTRFSPRLSDFSPTLASEAESVVVIASAWVCPELRWSQVGVERADSLVVNAHKWLVSGGLVYGGLIEEGGQRWTAWRSLICGRTWREA